MPSSEEWAAEVVPGTYGGHPGLIYQQRPRSVSAVLRQAATWGDRTFIVHGDRRVSFGDLVAMVERVKTRLAASGVREGDRVGIFAGNSPEWVATFFAVIGLGAIAAPCNGWWSVEEMEQGNRLAGLTLVVVDERRRGRVPGGLPVIAMESLATGDVAIGAATQPALAEPDEERPATILFTAGTTAFPKGAVLSHRALIANLQTLLVVSRKLPYQLKPDARPSVTLVGLPLFHIGAIQLILVPMMTGNRIVFLEGRFDGAEVLRLIEAEQVTMFSGVPTMMERLLRHPDLPQRDVLSLRTIVLGGSPVSSELLDRITAAFPSAQRGVGQTYGLTEAGGVVSTGVDLEGHRGSSGRLAPVVEVSIGDPDEHGIGEVLVRSPACMSGYWGHSDDPTLTEDGWIHTGDLGRVDEDRHLYITGRLKDMIIRGGENVSSSRVEAVLQEHPGVLEVAVVGLPDEDLGEIVGAVVRIDPRSPAGEEELEPFARGKLAHFAVPSRWWFVTDPLPTNDSGKILKPRLAAAWQERLTPAGGADA